MRRLALALSVAALAALTAAGCGGGGKRDDSFQATTVQQTTVKVVGRAAAGFDAETLYRQLSPGVVTIISIFDGSGGALAGGEEGLGSGFVVDPSGYIATNAHVVTTGDRPPLRRASQVYVEFGDGNRVRARIVGADPDSDVALVKVDPSGLRMVPLSFGDSSKLSVGEPVAAIGSPFGEEQSLSVGVISALDRSIRSLTQFDIANAIQTDAAINHGNSGGPLIDAQGKVIGINSQIKSSSGGGEGVGFAVPANTVKRSIEQLRANGRVEYGYLGVSSQTLYPQLAEHLGLKVDRGALLASVQRGGPADRAGLRGGSRRESFQGGRVLAGGDVIVSVNGAPVRSSNDLGSLVALEDPGTDVALGILRDGKRTTVHVKLGRRPSDTRG
ncbi:MAG: trypsin-like peptidase domain-containing protein [Thermoleophilaceae bacterium]|nr:trypsin-like peptidase domain-containing protein [Thermoleophilaceae bacterium]